MKRIYILVLLVFAAVNPLQADAGETGKPDATAGTDGESSPKEKQYGVPPGMLKKGALPPRQVKQPTQEPLKTDILIPFEPATNAVAAPRAVPPVPAEDDKRVQSPRGSEVLPQPAPSAATSVQPAPQPPLRAATPKEERELEAELLKVIVSRTNPQQRNAALTRVASETGTTPGALEEQLKRNTQLSGGDLLMGNKIASLSQKPAEEVFAAHSRTKAWLATGFGFGVAPETLQETAARFVKTDR